MTRNFGSNAEDVHRVTRGLEARACCYYFPGIPHFITRAERWALERLSEHLRASDTLVVGDAPGADELATWLAKARGIPCAIYRLSQVVDFGASGDERVTRRWHVPARSRGKKIPLVRDEIMAEDAYRAGVTRCLALMHSRSTTGGTWFTSKHAEKLGMIVTRETFNE